MATIKATQQSGQFAGSDKTDFPVYFDLSDMPAAFWTDVKTDTNTHSADLEQAEGDYLDAGDQADFDVSTTKDLTVECWIKLESDPSSNAVAIAGKWGGSARNWLFRVETSNEIRFFVGDGGSNTGGNVQGSTQLSVGVWYHVAFVWDSSSDTCELFLNGVSEGTSGTLSPGTSTAKMGIGAQDGGGGTGSANTFDGQIDDVRVWNGTRTASQLDGNKHKELNGDETNLVAYWRLNNSLSDETSNNYSLTNSGASFVTDTAFSTAGGDIRCYSDSSLSTELAREVVSCDTSAETGELYVNVPTFTSGDEIWIDVDGSRSEYATNDTFGAESVWNSNFKAVYHLNESGNYRLDSTSNNNDLDDNNTVTSGTGQIGTAADFEAGNSEYLDAGDSASLSAMSPYTITAWLNIESAPGTYGIVNKNNGDDTDAEFQYFYRDSSGLKLQADFFDSSQNETQIDASVDLGTATWKHVVLTMDVANATGQFYVDGSSITTSDTSTSATSVADTNNALQLGGQDTSLNFDGLMDEVRILEANLSADWITTEYNNQNSPSTFWSLAEAGGAEDNAVFAGINF